MRIPKHFPLSQTAEDKQGQQPKYTVNIMRNIPAVIPKPNTFDFTPYPTADGTDNFNVTSLLGNAVLRWEYRPGSAFYLVWSHNRYDDQPIGENFDFAASRSHLWSLDANNVFLAKFTYYFNL